MRDGRAPDHRSYAVWMATIDDRSDRTPTTPRGTEGRGALRARGRAARAGLTTGQRRHAATAVAARVLALPEVRTARRVLLTRAVGDELDLRPLEQRLRAQGTTVALPVVDGDDLRVVDVTEATPTRPGWGGVPEPVGPTTTGPVDVVVVPALVLDRRGDRLGYGGGHFDRFLAGRAADATSVGAVFSVQLVPRVPTRPHDVRLDVVVTDAGAWRDGVHDGPGSA